MSKRSYQQLCPIALSLDLIGERWTLLIIRELVFGPRRYTDLLEGLPGIGTNLLADRLKALEEGRVIHKRTLPPPAASQVYELTPRGQALRDPIFALTGWGIPLLYEAMHDESLALSLTLPLYFMKLRFDPEKAGDVALTGEFRLDDGQVFHVVVEDGQIDLVSLPADHPDFVVETGLRDLMRVLFQQADDSMLRLQQGNPSYLQRLLGILGVPA